MARWGDLPKPVREVYARRGAEYGLSRSAVRGRINRGTWNPVIETPRSRAGPGGRPLQREPPAFPERFVSPMAGPESTDFDDAFDRLRVLYGDRDYYNQVAIENRLSLAAPDVWEAILEASDAEIEEWKKLQPPPSYEGPEWLWVYVRGNWLNVLWYK